MLETMPAALLKTHTHYTHYTHTHTHKHTHTHTHTLKCDTDVAADNAYAQLTIFF
jgi:hypothetical protein